MKQIDQWHAYAERVMDRHAVPLVVLGLLTIAIDALYFPVINAPFQGDDFGFLRYLLFNFQSLLSGKGLRDWIVSFPWLSFLPYFRPGLQLFNMLDYTAWGLNPLGYHLTNLVLHTLTAFLVFILCWQLTHNRLAAMTAGLLFAIMPIHVEAVSWFAARADGLDALWYLIAVVFFILFRRRGSGATLTMSALAFAMALLAKEVAITIPFLLIVYDWLYHREVFQKAWRQVLVQYSIFWGLLIVYLGVRTALSGQLGTDALYGFSNFQWDYLSQLYSLGMVDPFLSDMTSEIRWALLGIAISALRLYRKRRELWFGSAWAIITILPSLLSVNATIFDRYLYLPSIGLALVLSSILTHPSTRFASMSRVLAPMALVTVIVVYSTGLYTRNEAWARAAQITRLVTEQVRMLHPTLPSDARLVFVHVPVLVGGRQMQAFGNMLPSAIQLLYKEPRLEVHNFDKFPIWSDNLERTYFFEYNRRKITERADLVRALEERKQCLGHTMPAMAWTFISDAQGWEAWNDLTDFQNLDGMLAMRATGGDPYLASPEIDIPTMAIGDIEITMRVRGSQPMMNGALYWLASGQQDFFPGLQKTFQVQAAGEFHTYRVDIAGTQSLLIGDRIMRLRLDPTDAPAEIAIKAIAIYTHCDTLQDQQCPCGR